MSVSKILWSAGTKFLKFLCMSCVGLIALERLGHKLLIFYISNISFEQVKNESNTEECYVEIVNVDNDEIDGNDRITL